METATAPSFPSFLEAELISEGFTQRDATNVSYEYTSVNAEGESRTVYVDKEEISVCLSEHDGSGKLTRADKFLIRSRKSFDKARAEIFAKI